MSEYISSSSSSRSFYTSFRWRWSRRWSWLPRQGRRWLYSPLDQCHRILLPRRRCISPARITVKYWKLQKYPNMVKSANMRRLPWSSSWWIFFWSTSLTKSTPNLITLIASATSATTWSQSWQIVVSFELCLILLLPRNILSVGSFVGLSETEKNNQSQYKTDRHRLGHRPVSTGHHGRRRQGRGHHG